MLQPTDGKVNGHNGAHHNGADHSIAFAGAAIDVVTRENDDTANSIFTDTINPRQFDGVKGNDRIGFLRMLLEDIAVVERAEKDSDSLIVTSHGTVNRDKAARLVIELLKSFEEIKQNFKKKERGAPLTDAIRRMRSEMGLANHVAKKARVEINGIPDEKLTDNQRAYKAGLFTHDFVTGEGPAGTGKTAIAIEVGLELYNQGKVSSIVLVKPVALEKGENNVIGAFSGGPDDKFAPYFENIYDLFIERIGADRFAALREKGIIKIKPFSMMRGQNFAGAFVIVDEAQNCSPKNIRTVMSRLADKHGGTMKPRIVLTGDLEQKDTPDSVQNGLLFALVHYTPARISNSMQIQFVEADIKRSKIAAEVHNANKAPDATHPMYALYCKEFGIPEAMPTTPRTRTMITEQPQPHQ